MTRDIPTLEQITTPVRELNERIHEMIFADRALTPEEQAELAAYERLAQ